MVTAGLPALTLHSLLYDRPLAVVGHNESVQIKVKAILHCRTIDLGYQSACPG